MERITIHQLLKGGLVTLYNYERNTRLEGTPDGWVIWQRKPHRKGKILYTGKSLSEAIDALIGEPEDVYMNIRLPIEVAEHLEKKCSSKQSLGEFIGDLLQKLTKEKSI